MWGRPDTSDQNQPAYQPWGHNDHLHGWNHRAEAWEEWWQEHRNDKAEDDDYLSVLPVQVKKHKRKSKG